MCRHHAEAHREAHAGAHADRLGGEERLEDALGDFGPDAVARIAHFGKYRAPPRTGGDGDAPLIEDFAHRMLGIDEQVDEHLHHLIGIGGDFRQRIVEFELDLDAA